MVAMVLLVVVMFDNGDESDATMRLTMACMGCAYRVRCEAVD